MPDFYDKHPRSLESPASYAAAVTPNDDTDLPTATRALYVGTAGNLAIVTVGGSIVTLVGAGGWLPVRVSRVLATGTTAGDIIAVW